MCDIRRNLWYNTVHCIVTWGVFLGNDLCRYITATAWYKLHIYMSIYFQHMFCCLKWTNMFQWESSLCSNTSNFRVSSRINLMTVPMVVSYRIAEYRVKRIGMLNIINQCSVAFNFRSSFTLQVQDPYTYVTPNCSQSTTLNKVRYVLHLRWWPYLHFNKIGVSKL